MSPTIIRNAKAFEKELRALNSNNLTIYQIARSLKITPATTKRYMNHLGIKLTKRRKDRDTKPDLRVDEMVAMRKKGFTLDSIGGKFNITRERVRQILQRECPDFVFPVRVVRRHRCVHCEGEFTPSGPYVRFCSQKCSGAAKSSCFNRDTALDVMRERDAGMTWAEISKVLGNGKSPAVFRAHIQRSKKFFSAEEQAKYFPKKDEKYFKPDNDKELGETKGCEELQHSFTIRGLRSLFSLLRP
jgi:hypothetical protein